MPRMMSKKNAGQQSLLIMVAGVCFLVHFVLAPIASSTGFVTSSIQTRPSFETGLVAMHAEKEAAPAPAAEPEEEEEEEEEETAYSKLTEEQQAAIEAIIKAGKQGMNLTEVLREELALKTQADVKVAKLEEKVADLSATNVKLLAKLKDIAKDLGVGGLLGVMMNWMSSDDIAKEAKQKIVEMKKPPSYR
mmetsp:Transcript_50310/g.93005  ORF Transcript_50310/g.93005 Transcript_50310/m.93005 type:complete len:191 (-) Transcript_50310:63-635(-)